jgi:hypothetical protein
MCGELLVTLSSEFLKPIPKLFWRFLCPEPTFVPFSSTEGNQWVTMLCLRALHNTESYYHIPKLFLVFLDNSTSVIFPFHIVFSKLWVLFMVSLWPSPNCLCSSNVVLPDWTQYPGKAWVEWKDYLITALVITIMKTSRGKHCSESHSYLEWLF